MSVPQKQRQINISIYYIIIITNEEIKKISSSRYIIK